MKKILTKLICTVLVLCMLCSGLIACAPNTWGGTVTILPNGAGNLVENGGFIAETDNYVYFINGKANATDDNNYGAPIKGSLLVANKSDLTKTEVVVQKLFVASDYNAGVMIDGEYVYYGTPSTELNASGGIASDKLTFMRTKLDGNGQTDTYFTLDSLSAEYRIVKGDNGVCIYYYDATESAIVCYNTTTKSKTEVVKTDDTQDDYSLESYKFVNSNEIVAVMTVTIYKEAYDEQLAENPTYSRLTENYNSMFVIKAGDDEITQVVSGQNATDETKHVKFSIGTVTDKFLFYTQTTATNVSTMHAIRLDELDAFTTAEKPEIVNKAYVDNTTVICSLDEIYLLGDTKLYKTTLLYKDHLNTDHQKTPVCLSANISKLLFKDGDYIYYYDIENQLARVSVVDNKQVRISESTVDTAWYTPEIKTINQKQYIFYLDNSALGQSYVRAMNLTDGEVKTEEIEKDGAKVEVTYLDAPVVELEQRTKADTASTINYKLEQLEKALPEDGITATSADDEFKAELAKAKQLYQSITDSEIKDMIKESLVTKLDKYEKAITIANLYKNLEGIQNCHTQEKADAEYKDIYQQYKADFEEFKQSKDRETVDSLISNNLKSYYTMATKWFEAK